LLRLYVVSGKSLKLGFEPFGLETSCGNSIAVSSQSRIYHHHHHHQGQTPWWSTAASTVHCYCSQSWARLHAVCRPMPSALRSFSMVRVHDCLGRPGGLL